MKPLPLPSREVDEVLARCIQASMVRSWNCKLAVLLTTTTGPRPSKTNACPTLPGPKVTVPLSVPLSTPSSSWAPPSPFHQAIRPEGAVAHGGAGFTVNTALELGTDAMELLTTTE